MIRIYRAANYQELSRKAANIISAQVIMKPNCVLGLATGSSPIGTYRQLIEWYEKEGIRYPIDGLGELDRIFEDIVKVVDSL